jgi:hypothetical protein
VWVSTAAQAATIDWMNLDPGWDDLDSSGEQVFLDVDGSWVDVAVSYTDNMFDRNSVPDIYTTDTAPSPEIIGSLRFTNDRDTLLGTQITITFSEDVFITDLGVASLSTIAGRQENLVVEGFDVFGNAILATTYGTNTLGLVELDADGDVAYRSRGLGALDRDLPGSGTTRSGSPFESARLEVDRSGARSSLHRQGHPMDPGVGLVLDSLE